MNLKIESERYVTEIMKGKTPEVLVYHNLQHTKDVVEAAELIASKMDLSDHEKYILAISAWFHDIGYIADCVNHEDESKKMAEEFLLSKNADKELIEAVVNCIEATRIPQSPKNKIEEVLCDADLYHLGSKDFAKYSSLFREELSNRLNRKIDGNEYWSKTLRFFDSHKFSTSFGRELLKIGKEKNRKFILKKINKKDRKYVEKINDLNRKIERLQMKVEDQKVPARGVESMFRLTANNQISLSSIADNKANILITVNALILSIVVTMLVRKFSEMPLIIIPTFIFLISCLVTMVFAILSTRPKISSGTFTKEDIEKKKVNLLFFGNFYNMELDEYQWAIKKMMKDYDGLYGTMIMDQFFLGKVLAKKYKRLRVAYNIFMFGIVISVLAFAVSMIFFHGQ